MNCVDKIQNFIGITPTDASFTNVTQEKQCKHAYFECICPRCPCVDNWMSVYIVCLSVEYYMY